MSKYDYINIADKHAVVASVYEQKGIAFISAYVDYETREELCKIITNYLNNGGINNEENN